jgi:phosphate transport system permease protein
MQPGSRRTHLFGSAMTWLTAGALAINLLLVAGLIGLVGARGLGHFWPLPIERLELDDGRIFMGEIWNREPLPSGEGTRVRIKTGNRDVTGSDFVWVDETRVTRRDLPHDVGLLERLEWGAFHGFPVELRRGEEVLARTPDEIWRALPDLLDVKQGVRERLRRLEKREIDDVNRAMTQLRVDARALEREGGEAARDSREMHEIEADRAEYQARYEELVAELRALEAELSAESLRMRTPQGQIRDIAVGHIVRAVPANRLSLADRLGVYVSRLREFLLDDPRESNTEGGIFPAIFGTIMMVLLTSIAVAPFGVLAAIYLREYAREGPFVRVVRIAVNSLAGVPSIVFGVFGLGFFVYVVGGTLDQLFYADRLPTPTFGTGGILWASLTLALLTVPVVIVSTEEGLAAVPRLVREGSLALGATKYETLRNVVVPAATPAILTGLILAMARAAGEVAPLMIVGMVKLAPTLPLDSHFPFVHLERKFMHLGFHIYDVGFQSPNVEAVQPLVFATAFLLIVVVLLTNLSAILLRNRLRRKYAGSAV